MKNSAEFYKGVLRLERSERRMNINLLNLEAVIDETRILLDKANEGIKVIEKIASTGCLWARIMQGASPGEDLHRIMMITGFMIDNRRILANGKILKRDGTGDYLWSDALRTRYYRALSDLEMFTLENIGGKIQVPQMIFEGSIDGPCEVEAEKWVWFQHYSGPKLGEDAGFPHPEG